MGGPVLNAGLQVGEVPENRQGCVDHEGDNPEANPPRINKAGLVLPVSVEAFRDGVCHVVRLHESIH